MTRETKVGLLVGLGMILLIGIIVSDHLSVVSQQDPARNLTTAANNAQRSLGVEGGRRELLMDHDPAQVARQTPVPMANEVREPQPEPAPQEADPYAHLPQRAYALDQRDPTVQDMVIRGPIPMQAVESTQTQGPLPQPQPQQAQPRQTAQGNTFTLGQGQFVSAQHELDRSAQGPAQVVGPQPQPQPREAATARRSVTVESGDTLIGLAQKHLGAAGRWPELLELNRDLISAPEELRVGMELKLPAAAPAGVPTQAPQQPQPAPRREATTPATPTAPGLVPPQRLADAQRNATVPQPTPAPKTYTVQRGDTLSSIAQRTLGDRKHWKKLYDANRRRLPDADALPVGVELVIPQG